MEHFTLPPRVFKAFLIFIFINTLFFGCDKFEKAIAPVAKTKMPKPELTQEEIKRLVLLETDFTYSKELAKKDAMFIAKEFDKVDENKKPRTIKEVLTFNFPDRVVAQQVNRVAKNAKTEDIDVPEVYAINFDDNRGYAIIPGDKRVGGILGSASEGKVDSLAHPGLQVFLSKTIPYVEKRRAEVEAMRDSVFANLIKKLDQYDSTKEVIKPKSSGGRFVDDGCTSNLTYTIISSNVFTGYMYIQDVLLKTNWNQRPPYNDYFNDSDYQHPDRQCANLNNTKNLAGCVAIADAQTVAYFYSQISPDWQRITNVPKACDLSAADRAVVGQKIREIFGEYTYSARGCFETWAANIDIIPPGPAVGAIKWKYGFVNGEWRDYNLGDIYNSLQAAKPVEIIGSTLEWWLFGWWPSGNGHQWVIDGLRYRNLRTTVRVTGTNSFCQSVNYTYDVTDQYPELHHNWGWGTNINNQSEWYPAGVFGTAYSDSYNHYNKIIAYITLLF